MTIALLGGNTLGRKCNDSGLSKFIYIGCASLFTGGVIIECILGHLIMVPYREESKFIKAVCRYSASQSNRNKFMRCENKCLKSSSEFPCLAIMVTYQTEWADTGTGYLYDYLRTYVQFKSAKVRT
ncbi:unnamed protein product [Protopolystoma xenopodis]|uniref:Uncharacterized protein n=1 Tax=Protopolystoma xenopodis TaxID=117903 RepID=A0A3S5FCN0_9PLAT|nr:unnamed protein product [Protopolystoma xenopodis]